MKLNRFATFAWSVVGWNLLVIVWGAYVRASVSGDGCGSHWPLCNGEVLPSGALAKTLIELTHRLTSGVALLLVIALAVRARRAFPKQHRVRRGAALSPLLTWLIHESQNQIRHKRNLRQKEENQITQNTRSLRTSEVLTTV